MPKAFKTWIRSIKNAALWTLPVLKYQWQILITLWLTDFIASQFFDLLKESIMNEGRENIAAIVILVVGQSLFDLLISSALLLVVSATFFDFIRKRPPPYWAALVSRFFNQLLIENLRVIARMIFWLPFLILPAFYWYVRYAFVSFVVIFDSSYDRGEVDALKRAAQVTKGKWFFVALSFSFSLLVAPMTRFIITGGDAKILNNPVPVVLAALLTLFINIFTAIFLFSIFESISMIRPLPETERS